jgi:tRNA(Ile)-lysidine synthase TilS/MesJ
MQRCSKCILPETYPNITFDEKGVCNYCRTYKEPKPAGGENNLINLFNKVKKMGRIYDAVVPLSGGKDSTYVLYLATKVYKLNVLAYTFHNGFFNEIALKNIEAAIKKTNVDHVMYRPSWETIKKQYRASILNSGELCSTCGIGMVHGYLKLSADWHIPLILIGGSVMEESSAPPEDIYDIKRYKAIMEDGNGIDNQELKRFLIYSSMNPYLKHIYIKMGKFGRLINPLLNLPKKSEEEIGDLLAKEMDWQDRGKHFDCIAEPFSNYLREQRYGYSRRVCQYSNLIRMGEMTRDNALESLAKETFEETERREMILNKLDISDKDLDRVLAIPSFKYAKYCYNPKAKKVVISLMKAARLMKDN